MSLTEIMSGAGLSAYAEIGLVLFVFAFIIIVVRVLTPSRKRDWDRAARLPLDDESTPPQSHRSRER